MMTTWKYTIAHGFPEETTMSALVNKLRKNAIKLGAKGEPPKMGTHLTVLPPFYASEDSIIFAASLMKAILALYGEPFLICKKIDIFPKAKGEQESSLHLEVQTDSKYQEYVAWLKANNPFEWVHPPLTSSPVEPIFTPHISILLLQNEPNNKEEFLEKIMDQPLVGEKFRLPPPKFFKKKTDGGVWTQVVI